MGSVVLHRQAWKSSESWANENVFSYQYQPNLNGFGTQQALRL